MVVMFMDFFVIFTFFFFSVCSDNHWKCCEFCDEDICGFILSYSLFLCQICVRFICGSVVYSGSEEMTLPWKGRTFGRQTTVHWVLQTGSRVNQTQFMGIYPIVYHFVATNFGPKIIVVIINNTSVKPLKCKHLGLILRILWILHRDIKIKYKQ